MSSARERSLRLPIIITAIVLLVLLLLRMAAPYWEERERDKPRPVVEYLLASGQEGPYPFTGGEDILFAVSEEQLIADLGARLAAAGLPALEDAGRFSDEDHGEGGPAFVYADYSIAGEPVLWLELVEGQPGVYSVNLSADALEQVLSREDALLLQTALLELFCPGRAQAALEWGYASQDTNNIIYCGDTTVTFYSFGAVGIRPATRWEWEEYGVMRQQDESFTYHHLGLGYTQELAPFTQQPKEFVAQLNQRLQEEELSSFALFTTQEDPDNPAQTIHFYQLEEMPSFILLAGEDGCIEGAYLYWDEWSVRQTGLDPAAYSRVLLEAFFPKQVNEVWALCSEDTGRDNVILAPGVSAMVVGKSGLTLTAHEDFWQPPQRRMG